MRARRYGSYIAVEVDVEVDDVLSECSDEQLRDELASRRKNGSPVAAPVDLEVLRAVMDAIDTDPDHAKLLLERVIWPKWAAPEAAKDAYDHTRAS
jgi:hypothetical protein